MLYKTIRKLLFGVLQALLLTAMLGLGGCLPDREKPAKKTGYGSIISSKWKLREEGNGVQYFLEFKDSLYIAQYFRQYDTAAKMYPGEWRMSNDTLFINDRRGNFQALFRELNDSVMVLMRSDSVELVFDRVLPGFDWETHIQN